MVVDHLLHLVSVGLAVRRNEDQRDLRYLSDLVVVPQNVDQEVVAFQSADLDRIPAASRRDYPRRETEIGRETGKEIVIAIETVIAIAIAIAIVTGIASASETEIVIYYLDIDRQSDHLRDFKEKGIARGTDRDRVSLEMVTTLTMAIRQLTIIHFVNAIYHLERDRCRDIP